MKAQPSNIYENMHISWLIYLVFTTNAGKMNERIMEAQPSAMRTAVYISTQIVIWVVYITYHCKYYYVGSGIDAARSIDSFVLMKIRC